MEKRITEGMNYLANIAHCVGFVKFMLAQALNDWEFYEHRQVFSVRTILTADLVWYSYHGYQCMDSQLLICIYVKWSRRNIWVHKYKRVPE